MKTSRKNTASLGKGEFREYRVLPEPIAAVTRRKMLLRLWEARMKRRLKARARHDTG
jgi:hypothetical protein